MTKKIIVADDEPSIVAAIEFLLSDRRRLLRLVVPIIVSITTLIIGTFSVSETKERDILTYDHSMLP